jgi:hypothetical protein
MFLDAKLDQPRSGSDHRARFLESERSMKKLLLVAAVVTGLYLGWKHFGAVRLGESQATPADNSQSIPAANAQKRIDALSGAAPSE